MDKEMFERSVPPYSAHDLDAWKKGVEERSNLLLNNKAFISRFL